MAELRRLASAFLWVLSALLLLLVLVAVVVNDVELWKTITRLGDEEFYVVAAVLAYYALLPDWSSGLALVLAVLASGAVNVLLKYLLGMPRPPNPLVEVSGPGFPSGHAQVSASFWTSLALLARKASLAVLAAVVVAGVSLSRVYLRAHYEVDVIGGVLIGAFIGYASYYSHRHYARHGTLLLQLALPLLTAAIAAYNLLRGFEVGSTSSILGLSLAASATATVATRRSSARTSTARSVLLKWTLCCASILLLLAAHYATKSAIAHVRVAAFLTAGVFTLLTPVLLGYSRR